MLDVRDWGGHLDTTYRRTVKLDVRDWRGHLDTTYRRTVKLDVRDWGGHLDTTYRRTLFARVLGLLAAILVVTALPLDFAGKLWVLQTKFLPGALHAIEASRISFCLLQNLRTIWSKKMPFAHVGAVLSLLGGPLGCDPGFYVVWCRLKLLRRYLAYNPLEALRLYILLERIVDGCPGHGPVHLLVESAGTIGFALDPSKSWLEWAWSAYAASPGWTLSLDLESLSEASDFDVHIFDVDVVKSFETVYRGILDCVLSRLGRPGWFRYLYFLYHAKVRLTFKLSCCLGQSWTRDGSIPQGCPLSMVFAVTFYLPWCRHLQSFREVQPQPYADNLKCVSSDDRDLLEAARLTMAYIRLVGQTPAPKNCVLLSTSSVVRALMKDCGLPECGDMWDGQAGHSGFWVEGFHTCWTGEIPRLPVGLVLDCLCLTTYLGPRTFYVCCSWCLAGQGLLRLLWEAGFPGGPMLDIFGSFQLPNASHVTERDKALLRSIMVRGVWNGFLRGHARGEVVPCSFLRL